MQAFRIAFSFVRFCNYYLRFCKKGTRDLRVWKTNRCRQSPGCGIGWNWWKSWLLCRLCLCGRTIGKSHFCGAVSGKDRWMSGPITWYPVWNLSCGITDKRACEGPKANVDIRKNRDYAINIASATYVDNL